MARGKAQELEQEGLAAYRAGDFATALERFQEALRLFADGSAESDNERGVGEMWNDIGVVYYRQRRWAEAERAFLQASEIAQKTGNLPGRAKALGNLGSLCARRGDAERAEAFLQESLAIFRQIGDAESAEATLKALSNLTLRRGRWIEALYHYQSELESGKPTLWRRLQRWLLDALKRLLRLP